MKKVLIGILVVCIVALLIVTGKLYNSSNEKNTSIANQEAKIQQLENKVVELENEITQKDVIENEENDVELEQIPIGKVSKDNFKVFVDMDTCYYEKEAEVRDYDTMVKVNISNKKAYITIDSENETLKSILESENIKNVNDIENKEITGFLSEPVEVYFGQFGQDITGEKILFLMKDGSVEYINVVDMLKTQNYKSAGKIKNLSDVKQFDVLTVFDTEGGGYTTTIAIDKNGYYYDLNELF